MTTYEPMNDVDIFSLRTAPVDHDEVSDVLSRLSVSDISVEAFLFLICRGARKPLAQRLVGVPAEESAEWAKLANQALLHSFVYGDWLEPDFVTNGKTFWEVPIQPVSVARAEMLIFLGYLSANCGRIFREMENESRYVNTFLHLNEEPREHGYFDQGRNEKL